MLEKEIEKLILEYLEMVPDCFAWKNNNFGTYGSHRKANSRFLFNGISDILGIYRGKFLAIEVKTKTGKVTKQQEMFIENINNSGGIAFVARSVEDVVQNLGAAFERLE